MGLGLLFVFEMFHDFVKLVGQSMTRRKMKVNHLLGQNEVVVSTYHVFYARCTDTRGISTGCPGHSSHLLAELSIIKIMGQRAQWSGERRTCIDQRDSS